MRVPLHTWYLLIVTVIATAGAAVRYWQRRGNESWPITEGRIFDSAYFNTDHDGRDVGHNVRVQYSYKVEGEYYSGELVRNFDTERAADAFAARYPRDMLVIVRAHPEKHELSVMREDDNAVRVEQAAMKAC